MSIYSPKRRFTLAIVVCVSLTGLFWVFRLATSPFLDVERTKLRPSVQSREPGPEFEQDAIEWFSEKSWVKDAKKHFRDGGSYLFCNNFDLDSGRTRIDASPVAVLWRSESEDTPITLLADSAMLGSSASLLSEDSELGELTRAKLTGNVIIRGPRNLLIRGHSFQLDRKSMKLWSGSRIRFQWENHSGSASSGIEIQLDSDKPDGGLTDVTAVSKMQLLGQVVCDISVPPSRRGEEGIELKVSAPNGFSYDVPLKTARFLGRPTTDLTRRLIPKEEVVVLRNPASDNPDKLVCPELVMELRDEIDEQTGQPVKDKLKLNVIRAWGRKVFFQSPDNKLKLLANRVRYFVDARRLEIEMVSTGSINSDLLITQDTSSLSLPPTQTGDQPQIQVLHMKDGSVQRIECSVPLSLRGTKQGRGRITSRRAAKKSEKSTAETALALTAEWGESLLVQLAPDKKSRIVRINGRARVAETVQQFGLAADTIAAKLVENEIVAATAKQNGPFQTVSVASPVKAAPTSELNFSEMTPELLTAEGNVALRSPQGSGRLRDKLTVEFEAMGDNSEQPAEGAEAADKPSNTLTGSQTENAAVSFGADTLKAMILIGEKQKMKFRDVWLNGDVSIERKSDKPTEQFAASGNQLYAYGGLTDQREIQLFGDPARVISPSGEIAGPRIDLNEVGESAKVVGSGSITFVTDKSMDGKPLDTPTPIEIFWTHHMEFRKKSATFYGNIRVSMVDETGQKLMLKCGSNYDPDQNDDEEAGLTVHFNEDVSLGAKDDDGGFETFVGSQSGDKKQAGRVERIECHSKVTVTIEQQSEGVPSGRHFAVFADLDVNLETGDFNAIGPGMIESVTPDEKGQLQGTPPVTARANSPAQTTETAFVYMQVEFIGELVGNLRRKEAALSQNVVAVVTPARRVDEKIDLQIVSTENLPVRAGILRAESLSVSSVGKTAFAIVARDNASLESQRISAKADVINYDSSKEQFIMRADGSGKVTVIHRSGARGKFNRFNGKRFEYYDRTNDLRGDGINGLDVSNFQTGTE